MNPGDIRYWSSSLGSIILRRSDGYEIRIAGSSVWMGNYALNDRDSVLLLYRTSKEVDRFIGIPFWKVVVPTHGIVYCQEGNLAECTVEDLKEITCICAHSPESPADHLLTCPMSPRYYFNRKKK